MPLSFSVNAEKVLFLKQQQKKAKKTGHPHQRECPVNTNYGLVVLKLVFEYKAVPADINTDGFIAIDFTGQNHL